MSGLHGKGTTVPVERSQERLVLLLQRYGAHDITASVSPQEVRLAWTLRGQRTSVAVPMPVVEEFSGRWDWETQNRHEQATRERWRAIELVVKGRCEAVGIGLVDVPESLSVAPPPPPAPRLLALPPARERVPALRSAVRALVRGG